MAILTSYESGGSYDNLASNSREAQGFKIPSDSLCTSVSFKLSKGSTSTGTTIDIAIYSGTENGTLVKTETFPYSLLQAYNGSTTSWTEFVWTTPVSLTAGTQYFARLTIAGSGNDEIRRSLDPAGTYADGTIWFNGIQNTSYDMLFRVSGTTVGAGSGSNLLLLGIG